MLHRETDVKKVERNKKAVFDLNGSSLEWLEKYTGIPYRFGKFDFVLIPSFQFSGMEHPGAIYYNSSSILLDESATENQMLNRASVIAHETSHMWFGDLVTMQWFNDVWMKEVFANFMAAKIVNPSFPKVNHDLRFLVANYPAAYAVDRTAGTHPVRQEVENLDEAGSLYGAIIYQKAPIVKRQLERLIGADRLQSGLRSYLKQFQFGNATWLDLVRILNEHSDVDMTAWSRAWVEEAGRPSIRTVIDGPRLAFIQSDPQRGRSLRWTERMEVLIGTSKGITSIPVELQNERTEIAIPAGSAPPQFVLPTGGGLAYGDFILDDNSRAFLLQHLPELTDPLVRGAAWVTLWEEMLGRRVQPSDFLSGGTSKRTNGNCNTGRLGAAAIRTSYRRRPCLRRLHTRRQQPRISSSTSARIDGSAGTWRCVGHVVGRNAWPARAAVGFSFRWNFKTNERKLQYRPARRRRNSYFLPAAALLTETSYSTTTAAHFFFNICPN